MVRISVRFRVPKNGSYRLVIGGSFSAFPILRRPRGFNPAVLRNRLLMELNLVIGG
jgi:hypothetical protein